jgi:hypothetical protein
MASTITFTCYSCGQVLKVGSDKAGKKAKCIKCGTILTIPVASDEEEVEEVRAGPPRRSSGRDEDEDDRPRKRRSRDEDEEEEDRPRSRRGRDDDEDDDDRPRRRRSRDDDDQDDEDRPRSRRGRDDDDEDEEYDRPRKRRSRDDEDEDEEYDRRRRRKSGGSPWGKVRIGMLFEFITSGMLIGYSGCMLLGTLMILLAILARSIGMLDFGGVLFKIGMVLYVALQAPAVTGYVFTVFTPNKRGALGLGITSLVLGAVNLVIKIVFFMVPFFGQGGMGGPGPGGGIAGAGIMPMVGVNSVAMAIILVILFIILLDSEYVLYPLYLRSVSQQLKERWLEGGCIRAMGFACGVIGSKLILVLLTLIIGSSSRGGPSPAMGYVIIFLAICVMGVMLAFAIMYMKVIGEVKSRAD